MFLVHVSLCLLALGIGGGRREEPCRVRKNEQAQLKLVFLYKIWSDCSENAVEPVPFMKHPSMGLTAHNFT